MRDTQGFDEFYRMTSRRVLGYAFAISRDWAQAQDLTQEAYLRAWRAWHKLSGYSDPEAWVRLIIARLATDFWRRLGRRQNAYQRTTASTTDAPAPGEDTILVTQALMELPVRQRQAITLHYIFDQPVAQIARDLNVPPGTVKSWLSRGRVTLAGLLDPERERQIPPSAKVRGAADRRARRRAIAGAVSAIVAIVAGATGIAWATRPDNPPPIINPSPSPSVAPSAPPSQAPSPTAPPSVPPSATAGTVTGGCLDTYAKTLPVTLFDKGEDRYEICFKLQLPPGQTDPLEYLPRPCRPMTHQSDALIADRRGMTVIVNESTNPNERSVVEYSHTVTKYGSGGAQAYLAELRASLDQCGPLSDSARTTDFKALTTYGAGPDRVVIREEWVRRNPEPGLPAGGFHVILAQRVGDYMVIIYDHGWEGSSSKPETITAALDRGVAAVSGLR